MYSNAVLRVTPRRIRSHGSNTIGRIFRLAMGRGRVDRERRSHMEAYREESLVSKVNNVHRAAHPTPAFLYLDGSHVMGRLES